MIVKKKDGYYVMSEEGKSLGGPYHNEEQAKHRLNQVEMFKHLAKKAPKKGTDK